MDKVFIQDLRVRGIIGVYEQERTTPQDILINITLLNDQSKAGLSDQIADCIDYATVAEQVRMIAETAHRFTVEALAADLAKFCLGIEGVHKVIVRVEKPGVIPMVRSVGVEIERDRDAYPF